MELKKKKENTVRFQTYRWREVHKFSLYDGLLQISTAEKH